MKGYLKIAVLTEIKNQQISGYDLMKNLELILGKKPSPGSIYPLLNEFLSKKIIKQKIDGRRKLYSLTAKGKNQIIKINSNKKQMIIKHFEFLNSLQTVIGTKPIGPEVKVLNMIKSKDESSLLVDMQVWINLKNTLIKAILKDQKHEKHKKEIIAIIQDAAKKIKKL